MAFSWREEVRVAHELPQMIAGSTEPGNDPLWVKSVFNATRLSCDARDLAKHCQRQAVAQYLKLDLVLSERQPSSINKYQPLPLFLGRGLPCAFPKLS